MLEAIHSMESREASAAKTESVAAELESMGLKEAAKVVREGFAETLSYCGMPREHWRRVPTTPSNACTGRQGVGSVLSARFPTESRLLWWWLPA